MTKVSLTDLRNGTATARKERVYPICLRLDLMAEVDLLLSQAASRAQGDDEGQPQRLNPEKSDDATERLKALEVEIDDATGDLRLRAIPDGEWRRWVNDHPAREGDERDEQLAYGFCNTDDLASDLERWALSWNGEDLKPGDWKTLILPNASGGDLKALVNLVVNMQEAADDPKWLLRGLRSARSSSDSDPSPAQ